MMPAATASKMGLTFPNLSDFEKGWYGISLKISGTELGPHPDGLSWMEGSSKRALISLQLLILRI